MSKVKHLLRKLHIGDHQHHGRPPPVDPSAQTTPSQESTSTSTSFDLPPTTSSSENENTSDGSFSYFEEEFQVQLALAISVSDQGRSAVDSENAQIDVAKQISLGRSPTQNVDEFISLRYWSCNVVSYDEKVSDGFYDICGTATNLVSQSKMPSLIELKAVSTLDDNGYEVVLVNRAVDVELRHLEERVYFMSLEHHSLDKTLNTSFLVKKIADLIVERMGGPVVDVEDMFSRWRASKNELRIYLNTIVLPLGSLDIGHSRQRALLFKVLADRINLPCKLVKGSYYTGTDEGAVNLIKLDDGSEYIIDLMGAPGTLIPSEVPSSPHQNFELDGRSTSAVMESDLISCIASDQGSGTRSSLPIVVEAPRIDCSVLSASAVSIESSGKGRRIAVKKQAVHSGHDYEVSLNADKQKRTVWGSLVDDSNYDNSPVNEPEYARELGISRIEKCISPSNVSLLEFGVDEVLEKNGLVGRDSVFDQSHQHQNKQSRVPLTSLHLLNKACNSTRKPSDEAFGTILFEMDYKGHESSLNVPGEINEPVKARDELISDDNAACREGTFSDAEGTLILSFNQSGANKIQDVQMEPVMNGVAEILWEDLQIGERIGIGSYGEVYRSEWNDTGTEYLLDSLLKFEEKFFLAYFKEVAVKKFMNQDITGDALAQFKSEIEIMLRLRHPNVVLFMGAVTRPPNMSILTEYLPRGSLYKLLHRPNIQIDERRRIKMALDVAKGMNYLHTSNPTIVHRDLKTPNLLVDKNWVVKVCDFGMSRLQHHTFLSSKSTAGTAEWMAPEVLRNEQSNEKSDVYSFGVILWELATLQVPWAGLNSMQVVGAVGFQSRHLDILPTVDPLVAEIISDCWNRNPQARPSFAQIIARLKRLQQLTIENCK